MSRLGPGKPAPGRNLRLETALPLFMKKSSFLVGLLAVALSSFSLVACGSSATEGDDDVATAPLPPIPEAPDSTKKDVKQPAAYRELTAPNASEDIKKMQPQM